jgi:hypothetical protein
MNAPVTGILNESARYFEILEKERLVIDAPIIFCGGEMNNSVYVVECSTARLFICEIPLHEPI